MKRWKVGILTLLLLVLATVGAYAYGPGHGYGPGAGPDPGFVGPFGFAAKLNLSNEQMEKMWQMKEKFRNDTQKVRYELFQKRLEMRALFSDPKSDDAAILAKQKEMNALRQNMADKMVEFRLAQRKVLTHEQLKKLGEVGSGGGLERMRMGLGPGDRGPFGMDHGFGPGRDWNCY